MGSIKLPDGGLAYGKLNDQKTSTPDEIVTQVYKFLQENLVTGHNKKFNLDYSFCKPSAYKYGPSQWLWDSGSHQIIWARKNVDHSIADLRGMLNMQRDDGRIPEEINWLAEKQNFFSNLSTKFQYSHIGYTDITQMPVLPYSLRAIYEQKKDKDLLVEFVPKILKYFEWYKKERDIDGSGLVTILHPWESGLDLSPAYDPALGVPQRSRAHPTWCQAYFPLIRLVLQYNFLLGWRQKKILDRKRAPEFWPFKSWFRVQDIAVNCVYASGWGVLGELASQFDQEIAQKCFDNQKSAEEAIMNYLYDPGTQLFRHRWQAKDGTWQVFSVKTVQILFPVLLSSLPQEALNEILKLLRDPNEFGTNYMVPTVSKAEPPYNPIANTLLLWRGPVWGFTNWFIMEGLDKHGQRWFHFTLKADESDDVNTILNKWIAMAEKSGIWEHYNPETGVGYGAEGLGMSCLIVDWMARLGRVTIPQG